MKRFYILPFGRITEAVQAGNAEDALLQFAENMDTDMHAYFKAVPEEELLPVVLGRDAENGTVYDTDTFFRIYCIRKRMYKDGSFGWDICIELKSNPSKYMVVDHIRGSKEDAQKRCRELMFGSL